MRNHFFLTMFLAVLPLTSLFAADQTKTFDDKINGVLQAHYASFKDKEYFSGIALSIYKPKQPIKNYYVGHVSHNDNSKTMDDNTLFQIGSITKSFTSAIILQLEKEKKLQVKDNMLQYLPEYSKWTGINIQSLLDMTSCLPNYTEAPVMLATVITHPDTPLSDKETISYVYPPGNLTPPLKTGYFYSNTNYTLAAMIIEKLTGESFQSNINKRLIEPAHLNNTYYPVPSIDSAIESRVASGYGYNPYDDPELVGKDTSNITLSWAGAAGAVLSNTSDVIKWVKALFIENTILDAKQKKELEEIVSVKNGKPVKATTSSDPGAFGLGIAQKYDPKIGRFWFYEGETLGFRAIYMYVPGNGIIISSIFNSAVNSDNDHVNELMKAVYALTVANTSS